jgi:hypothetical protein
LSWLLGLPRQFNRPTVLLLPKKGARYQIAAENIEGVAPRGQCACTCRSAARENGKITKYRVNIDGYRDWHVNGYVSHGELINVTVHSAIARESQDNIGGGGCTRPAASFGDRVPLLDMTHDRNPSGLGLCLHVGPIALRHKFKIGVLW